MKTVKHKIIQGFPCNDGTAYAVFAEDVGLIITPQKETYDKAMKDGYIELKHEEKKDE